MLIEPPQAVNTEYLEGKKKKKKEKNPLRLVSLCWQCPLIWGSSGCVEGTTCGGGKIEEGFICPSSLFEWGGSCFFKGGGRGYYNQCYWSSHTYWNCSKLYSWLLSILEKGLNFFSRTLVCNRKLWVFFFSLPPHTFPPLLDYGSYIHTCPATTISSDNWKNAFVVAIFGCRQGVQLLCPFNSIEHLFSLPCLPGIHAWRIMLMPLLIKKGSQS